MGVIHRFDAPGTSAGRHGRDATRALDAPRAAMFLRCQGSLLRQGLARAEDPAAVAVVLGTHDASHERWCALVVAVEEDEPRVAAQVAALYGYHGRVIGLLERGPDRRLDRRVRARARLLLAERLDQLTISAADALERHGRR